MHTGVEELGNHGVNLGVLCASKFNRLLETTESKLVLLVANVYFKAQCLCSEVVGSLGLKLFSVAQASCQNVRSLQNE
jgi:hypothetical protein